MKKKKIIISAAIGLAVVIAIVIAICAMQGNDEKNPDVTTTEPTTQAVVTPELPVTTESTTSKNTVLVTDKDTITPDERIELTTQASKTTTASNDTIKPATPVTTQSGDDSSGGIVIIGDDDVNVYSCGVKGHHCDSAETHSFIVSLEKQGCSICGSHSCKSFYCVDEWGNAVCDITKCPKYTEKSDPCIYCQECGKKVGDGDNGTCVRFTVDCTCPICGKTVKAKTCHTH